MAKRHLFPVFFEEFVIFMNIPDNIRDLHVKSHTHRQANHMCAHIHIQLYDHHELTSRSLEIHKRITRVIYSKASVHIGDY